jgi:hypothetical protein
MYIKINKNFSYYKKLFKYTLITWLLSSTSLKAANCTIAEAKINFGTILNLENKTTTGMITIVCSSMAGDIPYVVSLVNPGRYFSIENNYSEKIFFEIYTTPNYAYPWTQEQTIKGTVKNINGNGKEVIPIYAKIKSYNQTKKPRPGEYQPRSNQIAIKLAY